MRYTAALTALLTLVLAGCTNNPHPAAQELDTPELAADSEELSEQAKEQRLKELLAQMDPGPLTREEYRTLTAHPYAREPFQDNTFASQAYFNGFRSGFAIRTREPGQLVYRGRLSGSIVDAANDAGFSAGITGDMSQLTLAEKHEVETWKQHYEEVSMWPYLQNANSEIELKFNEILNPPDSNE